MKPSNRTLSMMSPKVRQSIMAVSVVTALGLHAGEYVRIGDQWKTTSEYQEYLKKGGDNSLEGKAIKEKTITRLTNYDNIAKAKEDAAKWQEVIDILEKLP